MTEQRWDELVQAELDAFDNVEFSVYTWHEEKAKRLKLMETIDEITFIFNQENKVKVNRS